LVRATTRSGRCHIGAYYKTGFHHGLLALSPDDELLYSIKRGELLKLKNDGKKVETLLTQPHVNDLHLSPDGALLAYSSGDEKTRQDETVIVDTKSIKVLKTLPITSSVEWTPDGRALSFVDTLNGPFNVWTQSLAGGKPRQITHFVSDVITHHGWSQDGKYLAMVRRSNLSDLFLLTIKK
jgi:Tol biopolymer transport system component